MNIFLIVVGVIAIAAAPMSGGNDDSAAGILGAIAGLICLLIGLAMTFLGG